MRGRTHEHKGAAHHPREHHKGGGHTGRHHRAKGGGIMEAGGNPEVMREAHEKKHGGKVHRHKRKHGGHVEGHHPKHRMDRHHRKSGGRVGADHSPLSSAHNASDNPGKQPKSQQGGMST